MKRLIIILLLCFATVVVVALVALIPSPLAADAYADEDLEVDGVVRHYRLVIPHRLTSQPPIVFAFHGMGDTTQSMAGYSCLDGLAARHGFILVYPAAQNSMWSTIDVDSDKLDANPDVRFFNKLVDHLSDQHQIDRGRVYVVGMSNGASFAQVLATACDDQIAAVVAHSGPLPRDLSHSDVKAPIMLIVGEEDSAAAAIERDAQQYQAAGCTVKLLSRPGLGHKWCVRYNYRAWSFLSKHSLAKND